MKILLKSLALLLPFLLSGNAHAQLINTNDTSVCPGTTITLSANGSTVFSLSSDDQYSQTIELPFLFKFYGIDYSLLSISSNGYVQFRTVPAGPGTYSSWSITTGVPGNPNVLNSAMGFYADINMAIAGSVIQYATIGTAPNRKFVVTFCNCAMFSCTSLKATFQMIFYEGSNNIAYQIQNAPTCLSWNSGRAIQGVQNATGTAATTTPGRNFPSVWSATNDGQLFEPNTAGTSYTVTPIPFALEPVGPMISWYKNGTTLIGTGGTIDVTITEPAFYVAIPSAAGPCWSTALPDTVWVDIHNTLPPVVTSTIAYCQGAAATPLTAASTETGVVFYWYTSATGGTPSLTAPTPSTATPGSTTWFVSAFKDGCESARKAITVSVLPTPDGPSVTSPVIYCQNDPALPLSATGPGVKWYTAPTGGIGSTTAPTPNTAIPGSTTYYVTQTGSVGCESDRSPLTVTVNPTPALPGVTNVTYCQGDNTVPLYASGTGLLWYNVPTGGTGVATPPTPASGTPGIFNWYVTQTIAGCEGLRANVKVTVIEKPGLPKVEDRLLCQHDQAQALTAQGVNLLWYTVASGGTGSTTAPVPDMDTPNVTDYFVTQTINGCESNRARIRVTVNPQIVADFTISKMPVCNTDTVTVTFTGIAPPSATFKWELTNTILLSGDLNASGPLTVRWETSTNASIRLTVTNLNCTDTKVWDFPVGLAVTPEFDIPDFICVDQPARLLATGNSAGAQEYFWEIDGGNSDMGSHNEQNLVTWNTPGIKTVTLRLIKDFCRSYSTSQTILVRDLPPVQILDRQEAPVCEFDTVTFHASEVPGYEYLWLPSEYVWTGQGSPVVQMLARGQKNISVLVTDRYGCTNTMEIPFLVEPCCQVSMPTAFSPNGDGRNDIFRMVTRGHQPVTMFRVYNRWGNMVFESQSQAVGWDGTFNGEPAPMGSYHYIIQYNCEGRIKELKGDVTLIR